MLASTYPAYMAARSPDVGEERRRAEVAGRPPPASAAQLWVEFRHSQISLDSASRTPRAFSRAAASAPTIEDGLATS